MAAEKASTVKESLALDVDKQKEFEEKIKRMKDKVPGFYLLNL
jgi:predicted  nucleic acid-binding Zn-ribbon protein